MFSEFRRFVLSSEPSRAEPIRVFNLSWQIDHLSLSRSSRSLPVALQSDLWRFSRRLRLVDPFHCKQLEAFVFPGTTSSSRRRKKSLDEEKFNGAATSRVTGSARLGGTQAKCLRFIVVCSSQFK